MAGGFCRHIALPAINTTRLRHAKVGLVVWFHLSFWEAFGKHFAHSFERGWRLL